METIWLALIAVASPIIMVIVQGIRDARKERRDAALRVQKEDRDNKRQDEVAERVAVTAQHAADSAAASLNAHKKTAVLAAEAIEQANTKLVSIAEDVVKIHTLVNSDMTAARTAERNAMQLLVISLHQTLAVNKRQGIAPTQAEEEAIIRAEERIVELNHILADRLRAQQLVDEQAKAAKA